MQVFTFDGVLSSQRDKLYQQRSEVLNADGATLTSLMQEACTLTLRDIVPNYVNNKNNKQDDATSSSSSGGGGGGLVVTDAAALASKVEQFFPGVEGVGVSVLEGMPSVEALLEFLDEKVKEIKRSRRRRKNKVG
jgi:hypothetical protein